MANNDTLDLDMFFEDAKEPTPKISTALMTNMIADAGAVTADRMKPVAAPRPRKSWVPTWLTQMGGPQGVMAVAFSAVLGVAIGYGGADTLQSVPGVGDIMASISGDPVEDFEFGTISSFNDFMAEG